MNFSKKELPVRLMILLAGLFLYALGISLTVRANIGFSPWDVLHQGISNITGLSFGSISTLVGVTIVILNAFFKEKIGIGTIANSILIGVFLDVLLPLIPKASSFVLGIPMMLGGLCVIGFATAVYISVGLGSGPRDGLMLVITKKSKKDIALVRNGIELIVTTLGYLLGGPVGLGTLITVLTVGYFVKFAFRLTKFDVHAIDHQYLDLAFFSSIFKTSTPN